jgi:hypothetical protein
MLEIGEVSVRPGETKDIRLEVSQRYTGDPIHLPIRVIRSPQSGPTVFVTAAIHGDEVNGIGIIHQLMFDDLPTLLCGSVVLVPVVNVFGFEGQVRYMPDRRDLNRCFPGMETGSLTSRLASTVFNQVIRKCDYGIDLHTAAASRTNFPNVRADLGNPKVRRLARAFGCEIMVNSKGPDGALRREATKSGCATIILEAGEPNKIEPGVLELGVRGITNVLKSFDMIEGEPTRPTYQTRVDKSMWVRAEVGGILRFHVAPGELIEAGQPIATNTSVFGREQNMLSSPVDGIVLGMTTLPLAKPGEPICHIAIPGRSLRSLRKVAGKEPGDSLHRRVRDDLATNITVSEHESDWVSEALAED